MLSHCPQVTDTRRHARCGAVVRGVVVADPQPATAASEPLRVIVPPGRSYGIIDTNREEPPMTTTERTHDTAAVEGDIALIEQSLDHIKRVTADNAMRAHNAAQAGATLAYAVENFLRGSDPCDDCTEALREAWRVFMARHSGNFTDSSMVVR